MMEQYQEEIRENFEKQKDKIENELGVKKGKLRVWKEKYN